nr:hypothetical protein K-LCC10_0338 [Kaumoebavirus]
MDEVCEHCKKILKENKVKHIKSGAEAAGLIVVGAVGATVTICAWLLNEFRKAW